MKTHIIKIRCTEEELTQLDSLVAESSSPNRSSYIRTQIFTNQSNTMEPLVRAECSHCLNNIRMRYPDDNETLDDIDYIYHQIF